MTEQPSAPSGTPSPPATPSSTISSILADGGGLRHNEGKPPLELLPPEMFWQVAAVLQNGAKKYARRNWERGMAWSICYACAMRHLLKFFQGEDLDKESGLPHIWHALTNLVFLATYEARKIGTDDRPLLQEKSNAT